MITKGSTYKKISYCMPKILILCKRCIKETEKDDKLLQKIVNKFEQKYLCNLNYIGVNIDASQLSEIKDNETDEVKSIRNETTDAKSVENKNNVQPNHIFKKYHKENL